MEYPAIPGTALLGSSPSASHWADELPLPSALTYPKPPCPGSKHIFAFWHSGIFTLPPYLRRCVLNWHRRYSPLGWTIYVLDVVPGSPLHISAYLDITSRSVLPEAISNGALEGTYAAQHTSDLIRYPLLLKYGGAWLDAGVLQFGNLDSLWERHIVNPNSPHDFAGFTMGEPPDIAVVNFWMCCGPSNPLVERAHRILLKLWEGKATTTGMHKHALVRHVPMLRVSNEVVVDDGDKGKIVIDDAAMTDYAIQIQCMRSAQGWLDPDESWDGPRYVREKAWLFNMIEMAFVPEQLAGWSGQRLFDLLSQKLPTEDEGPTEPQALARTIVTRTVALSWCFKLMHGFSAKLFGGDTVGMLWRKHEGSDCAPGTYAGWLRWAETNCEQHELIQPMDVPLYEPTCTGSIPALPT